MQTEHPDDGFSGLMHSDGTAEIIVWIGGERVQSFDADHKILGNMAANLLMLAYKSAERTRSKPTTQPGSRPDNPPIPISACGLIASKKKKPYALGFVCGEAQIAFQIPQSMLARLGRQLLAASAQNDIAH